MLAYPIATAALLIGTASAAASSANPQLKTDFMRAMDTRKNKRRRRLSHKEFQAELHGDSKKSAAMREKMIEKSTIVKSTGSGGDRLQELSTTMLTRTPTRTSTTATTRYRSTTRIPTVAMISSWRTASAVNTIVFDLAQFSLAHHRCAGASV
mmetsp:Transcript_26308/g.56495  ORF Transcript_26308/g.56495 Transcript_26308/m.56495 type:complete len:153 (+) Transcript_26308:42-500(+)